MKLLITGVLGQLGYDVAREAEARGIPFIGTDFGEEKEYNHIPLDITNTIAVDTVVKTIHPDIIIHCAAYTAVDKAEKDKNACFSVNAEGTKNLVDVAKEIHAAMIYISTDYVFNGDGNEPWNPDNRNFHPLNVYGESKLLGELLVSSGLEKFFVVRTSWVFGIHGGNFIKTMLKVGKNRQEVNVINDQIGSPTYTRDLAKLLLDMAQSTEYGFYHATNDGDFISWYDLCCEAYRLTGMDTKVNPVPTAEYGDSKTKRPLNSRLSKDKLEEKGFHRLPDWKDAVKRYIEELNPSY